MTTKNDYLKLSKNDLLLLCSELKIKNCSSKNKNDLIDLILTNDIPNDIIHLSPLIKWSGGKSDEIKIFEK